jgi:hypothetical protein
MKINKFKTFYGIIILIISFLMVNLDMFIEYTLATESVLEGLKVVGYLGILWSLFVIIKSFIDENRKDKK